MADNVTVDNGGLTDFTALTDEVGTAHAQIIKQAISTDGSGTLIPADATNGLRVTPSVRKARIAVTPTVSTTAYAAGDMCGGKLTFTSAALASGGTGTVVSAVLTCRAANTVNPELDLLLFEADPTGTFTDNVAPTFADADLESARALPAFKFRAGDYIALPSNSFCTGRVHDGLVPVDFICSGTANLFGLLIVRTAFTLASTSDIVVALRILQD